jgi:hypothetical protein
MGVYVRAKYILQAVHPAAGSFELFQNLVGCSPANQYKRLEPPGVTLAASSLIELSLILYQSARRKPRQQLHPPQAVAMNSRTKKTKLRNFWSIYPVEPAWTPPLISLRLF